MLTRVNIRKSFAPKEHRMLMLNATCDDVFCDTLLYVVSSATALVRITVKYVHVEGCMHQTAMAREDCSVVDNKSSVGK